MDISRRYSIWSLVRDTARGSTAPLDMGYRQVGKFAARPFGNAIALVRAITYQHRFLGGSFSHPVRGRSGDDWSQFLASIEAQYVHTQ